MDVAANGKQVVHNLQKAASMPAFFVAKSCARTAVNACMSSVNFPFEWVVNIFTWKGATGTYNFGAGQQAVKTGVGSTESKWLYNTPPPIAQSGSNITLRASASHRLMNMVQAGTHLHGVLGSGPCTSSCGSQGQDTNNVMFWVDLDCTKPGACVVSQTAKIAGAGFNPDGLIRWRCATRLFDPFSSGQNPVTHLFRLRALRLPRDQQSAGPVIDCRGRAENGICRGTRGDLIRERQKVGVGRVIGAWGVERALATFG
jgi:hypothetical protein